MSGYLQRLFDRAAAALPSQPVALPGGPSLSPVAEADQRLNDPALAGRFDLAAPFAEEVRVHKTEPFAISVGTGGRRAPTPQAPPERRAPTPNEPRVPLPAASSGGSPAPTPRPVDAPPHPSWHPPAVGHVAPEDWVVEPEPPVPPRSASPRTLAEPEPPAPVAGAVARPELRAEPPGPRAATPSPATPPPAVTVTERRVVEAAQVEAPPSRPASTAVGERVVELREAESTTNWVEPAPSPPLPPLRPEVEATASPSPEPRVVERTVEPSPPAADSPERTARTRPLTANEASIIGPLAKRRRALTLFGLRRR